MIKVMTNDEIIQDFFEYIVALPEDAYVIICHRMMREEPIPGLANKMINKADRKRGKITEYAKDL
jgi:hypothetical protein